MGAALILPSLLAAFQAAAVPGPPTWHVERHEKFCSMGTAFGDGTALRIEYYAIPDLYHVVIGGPAARGLADKQKVALAIGNKRELRFQASGVKQDSDRPAVVYAQITDPAMRAKKDGQQLTNREFERYWRSRGAVTIKIGESEALQIINGESTRAFDEMVRCADKFAPLRRSGAYFRVDYDIRHNGARRRDIEDKTN